MPGKEEEFPFSNRMEFNGDRYTVNVMMIEVPLFLTEIT